MHGCSSCQSCHHVMEYPLYDRERETHTHREEAVTTKPRANWKCASSHFITWHATDNTTKSFQILRLAICILFQKQHLVSHGCDALFPFLSEFINWCFQYFLCFSEIEYSSHVKKYYYSYRNQKICERKKALFFDSCAFKAKSNFDVTKYLLRLCHKFKHHTIENAWTLTIVERKMYVLARLFHSIDLIPN